MLKSMWFVRRVTCAVLLVIAISSASGLLAEDSSTEIPAAVSAAFKKADRSGDQALSLEEFVVGRGAADVAKRDFKLYDFDENGSLSLEEFACIRTAPAFDQPGAVPDYVVKAADSSVAAIDKAFGNWDQNPEQRVDTDLFLSRFNQDMQQMGPNPVRDSESEADPNQNGFVTRAAARRFVEIQLGIRRSDGSLMRFPNGNVANHSLWLHIDLNRDDRLSRVEYLDRSYAGDKAAEEFQNLDLDQDSTLSFDEFRRLPWRGFTDTVLEFRTMDKDLDARLDRNELLLGTPDWKKRLAEHAFPGFDLDQDGLLSLAEYRLTPQSNMVLPWSSVLIDSNGDDQLSLAEFKFDQFQFPLLRMLYFSRLDTNGDKQLSPAEFYFKLKTFNELFVLNEDGTGWAPFFKLEKRDVGSPSVSPDGKTIGFDSYTGVAATNVYFLMDMAEHKPSDPKYGLMPSWAPDGKRLTISRGTPKRGAWIVTRDDFGREAGELASLGWGAQWSPDGKWIVQTDLSTPIISLYNVETKKADVLIPAHESPYQKIMENMSWSPDSSKICVKGNKADGTQEIAILDWAAKPKPILKTRVSSKKSLIADSAWHPKGHRIIIGMHCEERNRLQLYEFDPTNEAPPTLVPGQDPTRHNGGCCWTPDGKRLITASRAD